MQPSDPNSRKNQRRHAAMPQALAGGRYELSEFVSKGGMGAVYRARDMELDRWVAVKCLLDVRSAEKRAFAIREAKTLASLSHPNIMRVYDILTANDQVWIVSEWLEGRSLEQLSTPVPTTAVLSILVQMYEALAAAHEAQIVHRDIKPSNVIIGSDGRVTLIDFGVAFAPGQSTGETMAGSLRYTDPRILEGATPDAFSDCFSAALLQIEMMSGAAVMPDLAPLPLHRYVKKNFQKRVDLLLQGVYPPLAVLARRFASWPPSESVLRAADGAAREAAIYAQDQLSRITTRSPKQYLAETICSGRYVDADAEAKIREQAETAIASTVLTPRQKSAWFGFRSNLDNAETPMSHDIPAASANETTAIGTQSLFSWASPHFLILGTCLLALAAIWWWGHELDERAERMLVGNADKDGQVQIPDSPGNWGDEEDTWEEPSLVERLSRTDIESAKPQPVPTAEIMPAVPVETTPKVARIEPTASTNVVPIYIVANAWAELYVDGKAVGRLPHAKPFLLPTGKRTIKLVNPTTDPLEREVEITEGGKNKLHFHLTAKRTERVITLDSPGQLYVDGVDHGLVQKQRMNLTYGTHKIEVRRRGQPKVVKQIAIGPGSPKEIRLE